MVQQVTPTTPSRPHLEALSTYQASVGTLVELYGSHFPTPEQGQIDLVFNGAFEGQDGSKIPVNFSSPTRQVDAGTLRWTGFGPFTNPFAPGTSEPGEFVGTVSARMVMPDGEVVEDSDPMPVSFGVDPSLVVREFQPVTASCSSGVLRALGGAAYRMEVEAIGFTPVSFTYSFSAPGMNMAPLSVRHKAGGATDIMGTRGDFLIPAVPVNFPSYGGIMTVAARDNEGRLYQNAFAVNVHRPLEVFYNGNVGIAEVMAPAPVSGCIPGGVNGRSVTYTESQVETRSRSYAVAWAESWLSSHTVAQGSNETIGLSETNGVGFSTTDGQSFNWSLGTEVSGSLGLDKLVSVGVKGNAEVGGVDSRSVSQSQNRQTGVNASTTTTETESVSEANGGSQGESFAWAVSSSEAIATGFGGRVVAGTYGVFYRQTLRMIRRAALVAYNQCGHASVVADVDFVDWNWSPDLALGDACPPLPVSNLPPAECLVSPCTGE